MQAVWGSLPAQGTQKANKKYLHCFHQDALLTLEAYLHWLVPRLSLSAAKQ